MSLRIWRQGVQRKLHAKVRHEPTRNGIWLISGVVAHHQFGNVQMRAQITGDEQPARDTGSLFTTALAKGIRVSRPPSSLAKCLMALRGMSRFQKRDPRCLENSKGRHSQCWGSWNEGPKSLPIRVPGAMGGSFRQMNVTLCFLFWAQRAEEVAGQPLGCPIFAAVFRFMQERDRAYLPSCGVAKAVPRAIP
jgi:hypothetical protein